MVIQISKLDGISHLFIYPASGKWWLRYRYLGVEPLEWKQLTLSSERHLFSSMNPSAQLEAEWSLDGEEWSKVALQRCGLPTASFQAKFRNAKHLERDLDVAAVALVRGAVSVYRMMIPAGKYAVGDTVEITGQALERTAFNSLRTSGEFRMKSQDLLIENISQSSGDFEPWEEASCSIELVKTHFMIPTGERLSEDEVSMLNAHTEAKSKAQ